MVLRKSHRTRSLDSARLAEVPQDAVARFGAFHDVAGEDRQPGMEIVAAPSGELGEHVIGPVLHPGLPTVGDDEAQAALAHQVADGVLILAQIVVEIRFDIAFVEFVKAYFDNYALT